MSVKHNWESARLYLLVGEGAALLERGPAVRALVSARVAGLGACLKGDSV